MNRSTIERTKQLLVKNGYYLGERFVFYNDQTRRKLSLEKLIRLGDMDVVRCTMPVPIVSEEERRETLRRREEDERRRRRALKNKLALRVLTASKTKVVGKLLNTSPITEYEEAWMDYVRVAWG